MENRDEYFMREACKEAQNARWQTFPNPNVGACLVYNDQILARGYHHGAGLPHAEIDCLGNAPLQDLPLKDCTLYVTLEPCNHFGKTPPCSHALLQSGVGHVVFGLDDPNPLARGGAQLLQANGVDVRGGVLADECEDTLADFLLWQKEKRPFVLLKMAATLDGRIATRANHSQWISGEKARKEVHELRAALGHIGGAIMIGGNTFRQDNPSLTARLEGKDSPQPKAIIVTQNLPAKDDAFIRLQQYPRTTIFATTSRDTTKIHDLQDLGVCVERLPQKEGKVDFEHFLKNCFERFAFPYVLCEGGGVLAQSLLAQNLIDEMHLYLSPLLLCDNEAKPLFTGASPQKLSDGFRLKTKAVSLAGEDIHAVFRPLPASPNSVR